jgi:ankyrin repeat protein
MLEVLLTRDHLDFNASQASPIYLAAERGHLEVVRRLLSFETVNINQTVWRKSSLFIAIENGFRDIAKLLLQLGRRLDINAKTLFGDTAFAVAASYGYLDIVELLLEDDRWDVTATNKLGKSALLKAASMGHEQVVRCLCRDIRVRNAGDLKYAIESNIRIRYLLQEYVTECGAAIRPL